MYKLYSVIALISLLIRQLVLPNPFDALDGTVITISGIDIAVIPELMNYIIEAPLHTITFALAGLYYKKSYNMPAIGSILYFVFYCIHVGILYIMCKYSFSMLPCIAIIVLYIVFHIVLKLLANRITFVCSYRW